MDFDFHVRAEFAGLRWNTMRAQQLDKSIHQRFGDVGQGCINEGGTSSFAAVGVERELRNNDGFTFDIQYRKIGLALFIFENTQVGGLFGKELHLFLTVAVTNTQ